MTDQHRPPGQADTATGCLLCRRLRDRLRRAVRDGDETTAADCRVLLRRHPQHDDVPVPAPEAEA
ncbi:hypothetical protein [Streptomyces sp. NPDC020965]|uniref:hypothetical protein n=1 Tax=Streptomyces sp. NPDC020965 TaxID=3365105 RepID=UPI0037A369D6